MITATINKVFYQDQQNEPVELGETKAEAVTLDGYRFPMFPRLSVDVEEGEDPSNGGTYQLGIEMLIDGVISQGATNWIPNQDELRIRTISMEVPKHPVRLMKREKVHSVKFRIKSRRVVFGVPLPGVSNWNDLAESETYYYKIAKAPE